MAASKSLLGVLWGVLRGRAQREAGYIVEADVAVNLLAAHQPAAAEWWRQNAPRFIEPGRYFLFDAEACEEVPEVEG